MLIDIRCVCVYFYIRRVCDYRHLHIPVAAAQGCVRQLLRKQSPTLFRSLYGQPLSRDFQRPRHQGFQRCGPDRADADLNGRHRHHHHAGATARFLLAGRWRSRHLCPGHSPAGSADFTLGRPLRPEPHPARCHRHWRQRLAGLAAVQSFWRAGLDAVCVRRPVGLHAEHVGNGAGTLDRAVSRLAQTAYGVLVRVGTR